MTSFAAADSSMAHVQATTALTVREVLRDATAAAHAELERRLDLRAVPPDKARFCQLLKRFHGFHSVWEPAMQRLLGEAFAHRARLSCLRADLAALGVALARTDRLPICHEAADLVADRAGALGSLYVMEGSRLGGKIIARHLERLAPWLPPLGLHYFTGSSDETARHWHQLCQMLETLSSPRETEVAMRGALATFDLLSRWLAPEAMS